MFAPKQLSKEYIAWNRRHKAPSGAGWWSLLLETSHIGRFAHHPSPGRMAWRRRMKLSHWMIRRVGPFGFQGNSLTRRFEYPWCFTVTQLYPGMQVLEIGGGMSGFQFLLSMQGLHVTSVDPLVNPSDSIDWRFSVDEFEHLNRAFGGRVTFVRDWLENTKLKSDYYDRAFLISVVEHVPSEDARSLIREVQRVLKPGGFLIMTIDLFLDCYPFTGKLRNDYGSNLSIPKLIEDSGLQLRVGNLSQLYGSSEFDKDQILRDKHNFLIENNVAIQCVVLEKPSTL